MILFCFFSHVLAPILAARQLQTYFFSFTYRLAPFSAPKSLQPPQEKKKKNLLPRIPYVHLFYLFIIIYSKILAAIAFLNHVSGVPINEDELALFNTVKTGCDY